MNQREITELLQQLRTSNHDDTISKVLQLAADSVALDTLKDMLSEQGNQKAAKNRTRGNRRKSGKNFKITNEEILKMPKRYRKLFACQDRLIPYRFHKGVYEAHYRRHGLDVFACSKSFDEMKRKFAQKLFAALSMANLLSEPTWTSAMPISSASQESSDKFKGVRFMDYVDQWLAIKKQIVKPLTYKEYERMATYHFKKDFGEKRIQDMTRPVIQDYLFSIVNEGKYRTAEKLHLAFCCIFDLISEDFAIASPMKKIVLPYHESKKGSALTKEEERKLVDFCISHRENEASSAMLVLMYFGLRRGELKTIRTDGEMLTCITGKTKRGRGDIERTIPFTPVFKRVLPYVNFEKAKNVNVNTLGTTFKRLFPNHHVHELRYSFITRAKEAGCNQEVVMIWAGHSFDKDCKTSVVDRGYTDYSKEYLLQEAQKINYNI